MENDPLVREGLDEIDDEDSPVIGSTEDDGWDETEPEEDEDDDGEPL
jgi:hypothetical protein